MFEDPPDAGGVFLRMWLVPILWSTGRGGPRTTSKPTHRSYSDFAVLASVWLGDVKEPRCAPGGPQTKQDAESFPRQVFTEHLQGARRSGGQGREQTETSLCGAYRAVGEKVPDPIMAPVSLQTGSVLGRKDPRRSRSNQPGRLRSVGAGRASPEDSLSAGLPETSADNGHEPSRGKRQHVTVPRGRDP